MRKITNDATEAFIHHLPFRLDNTEVITGCGVTRLILHGNCIARKCQQTNTIQVTTAGWNTVTTRARLNAIPGVQVYTKAGQLYLNGVAWSGDWQIVEHDSLAGHRNG